MVDENYLDAESWTTKCIRTGQFHGSQFRCSKYPLLNFPTIVANMGKFSSDRAIMQYAEEVSASLRGIGNFPRLVDPIFSNTIDLEYRA